MFDLVIFISSPLSLFSLISTFFWCPFFISFYCNAPLLSCTILSVVISVHLFAFCFWLSDEISRMERAPLKISKNGQPHSPGSVSYQATSDKVIYSSGAYLHFFLLDSFKILCMLKFA